jgi:hypothetical protein
MNIFYLLNILFILTLALTNCLFTSLPLAAFSPFIYKHSPHPLEVPDFICAMRRNYEIQQVAVFHYSFGPELRDHGGSK